MSSAATTEDLEAIEELKRENELLRQIIESSEYSIDELER